MSPGIDSRLQKTGYCMNILYISTTFLCQFRTFVDFQSVFGFELGIAAATNNRFLFSTGEQVTLVLGMMLDFFFALDTLERSPIGFMNASRFVSQNSLLDTLAAKEFGTNITPATELYVTPGVDTICL